MTDIQTAVYTENVLSGIRPEYIHESVKYLEKKRNPCYQTARRLGNAAAVLFLGTLLSMTVLSIACAAGSMEAYEMLYCLHPQIAVRLSPLNESCTDNGIEMRVEGIYIEEDTAYVYIAMQDLVGGRIDATTDLFDSYAFHASAAKTGSGGYGSQNPAAQIGSGGYRPVAYDPESQTATFLLYINQLGENFTKEKYAFHVTRFLSGKTESTVELTAITPGALETVRKFTPKNSEAMRGQGGSYRDGINSKTVNNLLLADAAQSFSPVEGVTVTAYGFLDGYLHIQAYYEDILTYGNHGSIYLTDGEGNRINPPYHIAFWDMTHTGSFEEYVFPLTPYDDLTGYTVMGDFVTCTDLYEGDWNVTFSLNHTSDPRE